MFRRILVPLDIAQKNQPALAAAAEITRQNEATILLLHVIERIEHVPDEELKNFYQQIEAGVQRELSASALGYFNSSSNITTGVVARMLCVRPAGMWIQVPSWAW